MPGARTHYPKLLPLMNSAFESFDLSGFDLVVSSSHSCAKNVLTGADTLHVCYCHTPMRHAWEPRHLAGELGRRAMAARALLPRLRRDDLAGASRPDVFVANSNHVAARIRKYYRREATVVHPPWTWSATFTARGNGRLLPGAWAGGALQAGRAGGWRLRHAGTAGEGRGRGPRPRRGAARRPGRRVPRLRRRRRDRFAAVGRARLLFPGEEDFGIVPVEAQAAGVPVIAYGAGGVRDTVIENETGVFHAEQTVTSVASAILQAESMRFDEHRLRPTHGGSVRRASARR